MQFLTYENKWALKWIDTDQKVNWMHNLQRSSLLDYSSNGSVSIHIFNDVSLILATAFLCTQQSLWFYWKQLFYGQFEALPIFHWNPKSELILLMNIGRNWQRHSFCVIMCNVWCWSWALKTHRGPKTIFLSFQEIWVQTEVLKNKTYLLVVATFWCFFRIWVACYWERKLINPHLSQFYSNKNWLY